MNLWTRARRETSPRFPALPASEWFRHAAQIECQLRVRNRSVVSAPAHPQGKNNEDTRSGRDPLCIHGGGRRTADMALGTVDLDAAGIARVRERPGKWRATGPCGRIRHD